MTTGDWAIRAKGVSKKFGLTLRQSMHYGLRDIGARLLGRSNTGTLREGEFWAVNDVNFELCGGEALGIMGVNGSGKTTLLRILNGVYPPDRGMVQIKGRVGALIAAGAGFAPMLTGRENVYVNGALLGLSTREIDDLMDEIVAFAELGQFIDLPVKNYSSGMSVRLGFAVAALSRPDILLMDEVLAVGDLNFQKKCYDYVLRLKREGTAIILVSHTPGAIWAVCDRGIFMDHGLAQVEGPVEDVIRAYDDQNSRNAASADQQFAIARDAHRKKQPLSELTGELSSPKSGTGDVIAWNFELVSGSKRGPAIEIGFRDSFAVELVVEVLQPIEDALIRIVTDAVHYRNIVTIDNYEQATPIDHLAPGTYKFRISVPEQNLRPGAYIFNMAVVSRHIGAHLFLWLKCAHLIVLNPADRFLYSDPNAVVHFNAHYEYEMEG